MVDTVATAIGDWADLHDVVTGPGASTDAVADVNLLSEANECLRAIIVRAPEVKALSEIAGKRGKDRAGREAAGDAILNLRDQGQVLHALTSAALRWASSGSDEDRQRMKDAARELVDTAIESDRNA